MHRLDGDRTRHTRPGTSLAWRTESEIGLTTTDLRNDRWGLSAGENSCKYAGYADPTTQGLAVGDYNGMCGETASSACPISAVRASCGRHRRELQCPI